MNLKRDTYAIVDLDHLKYNVGNINRKRASICKTELNLNVRLKMN